MVSIHLVEQMNLTALTTIKKVTMTNGTMTQYCETVLDVPVKFPREKTKKLFSVFCRVSASVLTGIPEMKKRTGKSI